MPDRPFGSDNLAAPIYLAKGTGADDPGLAAWKQEHPNWMVAGNWTPAPRPAPVMPPTSDRGRMIPQPAPNAGFSTLDPATISVADFRRAADKPDEPIEPTNAPTPKAHAFRLPDDRPIPDHTRTENSQEPKPPAPVASIMTPYPASPPETMATNPEAEHNFGRKEPTLRSSPTKDKSI